jgi:ATP-dependent protease HslVU (ClpYQ) peptidase subunit
MSVIVAVKENGVVYMGADTQTTIGRRKQIGLNKTAFKITRLENGILVGFCGRVAAKQTILSLQDLFVLDQNGQLTKKHIVNQIVPKLVDKMEQIGDEECRELEVSILLAHKDKLYKITAALDVVCLSKCGTSGCGLRYVNYYLQEGTDLSVKDRILKALMESAKRSDAVGGPYILIDTQGLEYEIVDMGGRNY